MEVKAIKVWQAIGKPRMSDYPQSIVRVVECATCGTTKCEHDNCTVVNGKIFCDAVCAAEAERLAKCF
jgi:hypothetical protein